MVEVLALRCVGQHAPGVLARTYSPAATRKPQVPQAGSQMMSVGLGAVMLDHQLDDVPRGAELPVRHRRWRSCASMYSYRSPLVSRSSMGTSSIRSTTFASRAGVGDGEAGVLHVVGVGGPVTAELAQEREHPLVHELRTSRRGRGS